MTPNLFFALLGSFFVGILCIVFGRRGYRINDHPICRQCAFDLQGIYPPAITCPECGAGLKREGFIRIGARKRLVPLLVIGGVLVLVPLAPLSMLVYASTTGTDINKYLPTGLLLWQARHSRGPVHQAIADEVESRVLTGSLSSDQIRAIVETALDIQSDATMPWTEVWGNVIEFAESGGSLSSEQRSRYWNGAGVFNLKARPRIRLGDPLSLMVDIKESRTAATSKLMCGVALAMVRVGDAELGDPAGWRMRRQTSLAQASSADEPRGDKRAAYVYLLGSKSGGSSSFSSAWSYRLPRELSPGMHTVDVELWSTAEPLISRAQSWKDPGAVDPSARRVARLSTTVQILPEEVAAIELVEPTDQSRRELLDRLRPSQATFYENAMFPGPDDNRNRRTIALQFELAKPSLDFSFRVFARESEGSAEFELGVLNTSVESSAEPGSVESGGVRYLSAPITGLNATTIELVFRPDIAGARSTIDLTRIYNGELVISGVKLESQFMGMGIPNAWSAGSTTTTTTTGQPPATHETPETPDTAEP
ncbi:MAG: hypothetical protein KF745_09720 [Phycisphaeraceae bacterium]|nr:hypothetical protein [Phycisphaeraceae bacterium]